MERKNLFRRIMALTVGAAMALSLSACVNKTPEPAEPVTAEAAITRLQEQREALGFDNALDELQEKHTAQIGGDTYIRLQQYYEGLPVYGRTLVYAADEQGALTSLTGNVQDVDPALDLTPSVTVDAVLHVVNQFFADTFGTAADITVDALNLKEEDLCILAEGSDQKSHLAYTITLNGYELVIDAHDGTLLQSNSLLRWSAMQDLAGQDSSYEDVSIAVENGAHRLTDAERKITTFRALHTEMSKFLGLLKYNVNIDNDAEEIIWHAGENPPPDAVDAYVNTQIAYDYFDQVLENPAPDGEGLGQILLLTGIQYILDENGDISAGKMNNASSGTSLSQKATVLFFGVGTDGTPSRSAYLDWVAHEYMHAVEAYHSTMVYEGESGAIMEGLSDIFGELAESWATGKEPNWIFTATTRNMRDPHSKGHPAAVGEKDTSGQDYVHGYSTIISHSAYLMWNGIDGDASKKLSEKELAELWYRAVLMMPSDCDFILCRQLVEAAAQSMEALSDEQRAGIRQAFDQVQIPATREDAFHADYNLAEDCTLSVYDRNKALHGGYTLRINGAIDLAEIASTTMPDVGWVINRTVTVEEPGPYKLDLPRGFYALTITDRYCDEEYTIYVKIHEDHTETNIDLITAYEKPLIVVIPEIDYDHLVTDAYRDTFTDNYGYDYCYHIPRFNLNGNLTDPVNQKLYDQFYDILDEHVYDSIDEYSDTSISSILYSWGHHDDLASVVIQTRMTWEYAEYQACTISTATGQEVSSGEILAAYGMDDAAFRTLVSSRLSQYWEGRREYRDQVGAEFFDECMGRTLAVSNVKNAVPFINPDGGLSFIANIYSFAGADSYLHLINAEGAFHMDEPECSWDHSADKPKPTGDTLQYFIENCDKLYFTEADIQDFDDEMCMYARNAIFAKSGRKFQSQTLQDYFGQYSWYLPRVEPDTFTDDMLNRKQLKNLAVIQAREQTLEIEALMESLGGEAGIYTRYLHSGGYTELLGWNVDTDNLEVVSCLADLDNDGTKELYLSLRTGSHGIRGMEEFTYLLDIRSGQVVTAAECYFGGGSMGGDTLEIRYDTQTQTHVLVLDGYIRDGVEAFAGYLNIYSEPGFQVGREHTESYYSLYNDWYQENVDKIRRETTLYYEDGYDFRCFQIDGQYVTEEAYEAALARYEQPREGFQPKAATYANPVS